MRGREGEQEGCEDVKARVTGTGAHGLSITITAAGLHMVVPRFGLATSPPLKGAVFPRCLPQCTHVVQALEQLQSHPGTAMQESLGRDALGTQSRASHERPIIRPPVSLVRAADPPEGRTRDQRIRLDRDCVAGSAAHTHNTKRTVHSLREGAGAGAVVWPSCVAAAELRLQTQMPLVLQLVWQLVLQLVWQLVLQLVWQLVLQLVWQLVLPVLVLQWVLQLASHLVLQRGGEGHDGLCLHWYTPSPSDPLRLAYHLRGDTALPSGASFS